VVGVLLLMGWLGVVWCLLVLISRAPGPLSLWVVVPLAMAWPIWLPVMLVSMAWDAARNAGR